jgi:hypothetical protein
MRRSQHNHGRRAQLRATQAVIRAFCRLSRRVTALRLDGGLVTVVVVVVDVRERGATVTL